MTKDGCQYWIKDPLWGGIDYGVHYLLRCLSPRMASNLGKHLGVLAGQYRFAWLANEIIQTLEKIYPQKSRRELAGIVPVMWENIGRVLAETSINDKYTADSIAVINEDIIVELAQSTSPVIFLFVHLGNWELISYPVQTAGMKLHVLYECLPNRFQRHIARLARQRLGYVQLAPDYAGTRGLFRALQANEAVIMAVDEYVDHSVKGPTLGRADIRSNNLHHAIHLAKRFNARICPVYCIRKADNTFSVYFNTPVEAETLRHSTGERECVSNINDYFETAIKSYIEQWYMLHRLKI